MAVRRGESAHPSRVRALRARAVRARAVTATMLGTLGALLVAPAARAQERDDPPPPAERAIELKLATHLYAEGIGALGYRGAAGEAVELGAGYRMTPRLALGAYGSATSLGSLDYVGTFHNPTTLTAGLEVDWHFAAWSRLDVWAGAGSGWRSYSWSDGAHTTTVHGAQLLRLVLGFDWRLTRGVAIGPVWGVDLSLLEHPASFVFAGVAARFDIATHRARPRADYALSLLRQR